MKAISATASMTKIDCKTLRTRKPSIAISLFRSIEDGGRTGGGAQPP
jgi:hypothetical protein